MKPEMPADREAVRHRTILPRFRDAFRGLYAAYRDEPNLRFHVFAASGALVTAVAVRLEGWEAAYMAVTVLAVLLAELINTAVERTVDLAAGGRRHPLAGLAKEVAAGGVLLTALHATFAAAFVFLVRRGLEETLLSLWRLAQEAPYWTALPVLFGVMALLGAHPRR